MEVRSKSKNANKVQKSTQSAEKQKPETAKPKGKVILF